MKKPKAWLLGLIAAISLFAGVFAAGCDNGGAKITLSFQTNCEIAIDPATVPAGSVYDLPSMQRGGWSFEGWYDNADFQGEALTSVTVPDTDTSYYAKWVQMYLVVFDTDGGTLSADAAYVKGGDNVLEALSSYLPVKDGLTFGGWFFENGEAVGENYTMPEETITLLARYTVAYKAELYTKDLEGDGYSLEQTLDGRDFVGEKLSLDAPELPHFLFDANAKDNVCELKLQLPAESNVFRFYYDRGIGFTIVYESNAPAGTAAGGDMPQQDLLYGASAIVASCAFTVPGHRFAGWSRQRDGSPEYAPGEILDVTEDMALYAIWDRGYTDRLGGTDVIFLPETEPGVAILGRGGVECRGTVEGDTATFRPGDGPEMTALLSPSMHLFAWKNEAMAGTYYAFFGYYFPETESVGMISEHETLTIAGDMTAVYRYESGGQTSVMNGMIRAEEEGYSFVEGETARFLFRLGSAENGGTETPVFYAVGEEANDYLRLIPVGEDLYVGTPAISLDGMGGIVYNATGSSPIGGYYHIDKTFDGSVGGKIYTAVLESGGGYEEFCFMTYETGFSYPVWFPRDETACGEFKDADENTLSLDGYGFFANSAVYTAGGKTYEGSYTVSESAVFGSTVTLDTDGGTFTFRLTGKTFETAQPSGAVSEMYRLVQGPNGAALESLILVLYEAEDDKGQPAEIYVGTDGAVTRAAVGTCVSEDLGGLLLYTFTRTGDFENGLGDALFFQNTFTFLVSDDLTFGGEAVVVYYVYEHDGVSNYTLYTQEDGDGYIWQYNVGVSGMGSIYVENGTALEGSFAISGVGFYDYQNFASFNYVDATYEEHTLYFLVETNEGKNTYRKADFPSRTLVECPVTGADELDAYSSPYSLVLDGVGGAIYAPGGDASVNDARRLVNGTYRATGMTDFGDVIYTFYPEENTLGAEPFEFVTGFHRDSFYGLDIVVGMYIYHKKAGPSGAYFSSYGELVLDGFCNKASFREADGTEHEGIYYYLDQSGTAICFYDTEEESAFAIDFGGETFTVRDGMHGSYRLYDDSFKSYGSANYVVSLDGYGNAVLRLNNREIGSGVYTPTDVYYIFRLDFELNQGGTVSYTVAFASVSSSVICIVKNVELSGSYLAENWTVLVLDGFGFGSLIDEFGVEHAGTYSLIGAGEGAFEYTDGTGGFRFSYDVENASFAYNSTYFNVPLIYYASDLSSVVYNGMYAIYNGVPYYFNLNGTDVTLFTGENGEETHVTLPSGSTYVYEGKTYYRYTPGEALTFENADKEISIPLALTFTPSGENDYVAFETAAVFGTDSTNYTVAVGYSDSGVWESYLYDLYGYDLQIVLHWDPNGKSTYEFVEEITERTEEYDDPEEEGGSLTFYYYAVGSTLLQGRVIGVLGYGEDTQGNPFTFQADLSAMETIASYETELGTFNLSQILFTAEDGNLYAIRFFLGSLTSDLETERWYTLDSILICKEFDVTDESGLNYLVRTYQHVYAYPDYSEGYAWGDLYDADLYLNTSEDPDAPNYIFLTPRYYYIAPDESYIAWGVRFSDGTLLGFMIGLTYGDDALANGATVMNTYYGQFADTDANGEEHYFIEICYDYNLSLKQFEIIGITLFAEYDEESGQWKQVVAEFEQNEDGSWTATTEEGVYTLTVTLEEDFMSGYTAILHVEFTPNADGANA